MLKKYSKYLILIVGVAIIGIITYFQNRVYAETVVAFPIMSTTAVFTYNNTPESLILKTSKEVAREMNRVVEVCNYFNPDSELSRLNRSAHEKPFRCSEDLWRILALADKFYKVSDGGFDPTIRPLMRLWGFGEKRDRLPSDREIGEARKIFGFHKIVLNYSEKTVFFPVKGLSIDLGGIAKGWAVDRAADVMRKMGVPGGIVDLGGNVKCFGTPGNGKKIYSVGIKNPLNPSEVCAVATVINDAVSTSGSYERFRTIQGQRFSHIVNPGSGRPVGENMLSASVICESAAEADALSTALFVKGEPFLEQLEKYDKNIRCMTVIRKNGKPVIRKSGFGWQKD